MSTADQDHKGRAAYETLCEATLHSGDDAGPLDRSPRPKKEV